MDKLDPSTYQRVLVVSAHPDDPEFGAGATVAKLAQSGAKVEYVICTDGSQGGEDPTVPDQQLTAIREREQLAAAEVLGVNEVRFLGFPDGHLVANLELRKAIVREIRRFRPDLVITHSPTRRLDQPFGVSHPDHLATGEATLQAVYPDSRNPRAFRELLAEGLGPHEVDEVWLAGLEEAHFVELSREQVDLKVKAILAHQSQFQKPGRGTAGLAEWLTGWLREAGQREGVEYAETFRRLHNAQRLSTTSKVA